MRTSFHSFPMNTKKVFAFPAKTHITRAKTLANPFPTMPNRDGPGEPKVGLLRLLIGRPIGRCCVWRHVNQVTLTCTRSSLANPREQKQCAPSRGT